MPKRTDTAALDSPVASITDRLIGMDADARFLVIAAATVQVAHLGMHLFLGLPTFYSDLLQGTASAVSASVCCYKVFREKRYRHLWIALGAAFFIWTVAEIYYAFGILQPGVTDVPFSEALWLIYSFPILLLASYTPDSSRRDPAGWLDVAQASIFFIILIALFFPPPGIISQAVSDDVQGLALFLVLVLRCCVTAQGPDRIFFRNLTIYMGVYAVFTILYYAAITHGFPIGSIAELCWSIPFTLFSVLSLCTDLKNVPEKREKGDRTRVAPASYIQGISALGIAVMSMAASAVLAYHRPAIGGTALALTFALFAARTSAREWQLHSVHSRLNHSALHDQLTSVANRTLLQEEITRRTARPVAEHGSTALLFVGLDRFKMLNDCLGHGFGDLLLQKVAEILTKNSRKPDLVARYGGDEFVVVLDTADANEAEAYAERILTLLRRPLLLEGRVLYLTASIGFVVGISDSSAEAMMQDAHFAMHHAKKNGRDRVQGFEEEMFRIPRNRLLLEADLRRALQKDEISVFYQPIFAVESGAVQGFEALARWNNAVRGSISPSEFIPVAEDTGMIIELGQQVMYKACKQCKEWNEQFGTSYTMSVNVSAHQFASPNIFDQIVNTLRETGLDAKFLKLEMTESVLLSGYATVGEVLAKARDLGIQICLDDFGTGYSSLSYLLNYPFDVVKIDQSFVRNLDKDSRRSDVVRMLVDLAGSLDKHLVAEGVECKAEMDRLREFGCELVQGFLLSQPLPADKATSFLASENHRSDAELGLESNRMPEEKQALPAGGVVLAPVV